MIEISALTGFSDAFSVMKAADEVLVRSVNVLCCSSGYLEASKDLNHPSLSIFSVHHELKLHPSEFQLQPDPGLLEISV